MLRIKKNDTVVILTGRDKGKRGTVLEVKADKEDKGNEKVKVSGVAIVTKHYKARKQGEVSAIKKQEGYINASNVMLISPSDSKPTRVNFQVGQDGKKVRVSNRTKDII